MTTLVEVEEAVEKLPPGDLASFRSWFAEFDAKTWDHEFEDDVTNGRLEELAEEALLDHRNGLTTEL